jgi:hypothetical protein
MNYIANFNAADPIAQLITAAIIVAITIGGPLALAVSCWRDRRQ